MTKRALVRGEDARLARSQALESITDDLLDESQAIVRDVLAFAELDTEQMQSAEPPASWVSSMGKKAAVRRFRLAKAGWMSRRDCPVGLELARDVAMGIVAAKAKTQGGNKTLNVAFINMPPPPEYERILLKEKRRGG